MSDDLVHRMVSEAQNNQMIDSNYLEAGALLIEGADEITRLRARIKELERDKQRIDWLEEQAKDAEDDAYPTVRAAIDAAMMEQRERERITDEMIDTECAHTQRRGDA